MPNTPLKQKAISKRLRQLGNAPATCSLFVRLVSTNPADGLKKKKLHVVRSTAGRVDPRKHDRVTRNYGESFATVALEKEVSPLLRFPPTPQNRRTHRGKKKKPNAGDESRRDPKKREPEMATSTPSLQTMGGGVGSGPEGHRGPLQKLLYAKEKRTRSWYIRSLLTLWELVVCDTEKGSA